MTFGGLRQVGELYYETCTRRGQLPGRLMCSYFLHFADTAADEAAARARQIRYYKECVIATFPGDPETALPFAGPIAAQSASTKRTFASAASGGTCTGPSTST